MLFVHPHTVRFSEVNPAGILFFSRVAEHCHAAYEAFVAAAGLEVAGYFGGSSWKAPIARWEVDYHAPSRLGETLAVGIERVELGRSSLTMHFRVAGPDGQARTSARLVAVFVDGTPFAPCAIPEAVAAAFLARGATRGLVAGAPR